jgi:murein DD-endopeptidase MepM/ murein hydrolase activator NlpD
VTARPLALLLLPALLVCSCSSGTTKAAPASLSGAPSPTVTATPEATATAPEPTPTTTRTATPTVTPAAVRPPTVVAAGGQHAFPIRGCSVSYAHSHHDYPATDIFAARGCTVVAPVTGRVDEVSTVDSWSSSTNYGSQRGGLFFSIVGNDGVRYYGSHLSAVSIRVGQRVTVGQVIGAVGNTGDSKGIATHVHFGLSWPTKAGVWWVRRGEVYPWSYLDSWRAGGNASPAPAVSAAHRMQGDVPPCRAEC